MTNTTAKNTGSSPCIRARNLYDPNKQYKISRSKLDFFLNCPRCFYIDRKLGVGQPDGYPFTLNITVDELLKKEFDLYRALQKPHPLFLKNKLNAIPFKHNELDAWRDSLHKGIQYVVPNTNILLSGGIDDIWVNVQTNELIVVDYKATSKLEAVTLDAEWQRGYKRQVEIYQWLLRKNGYIVSNTAYFVYCNAQKNGTEFNEKLDFDISLLPYVGDDSWINDSITQLYDTLQSDTLPPHTPDCKFCQYFLAVAHVTNKSI